MASATDIERSDAAASPSAPASPSAAAGAIARLFRRGPSFPGSRLGRLIIVVNLLSLAILVAGALVLNEFRRGLVAARIDSLIYQAELIADLIEETATDEAPSLDFEVARYVLRERFIPEGQRARLFDADGRLFLDSYLVADTVQVRPLPPIGARPASPPRGYAAEAKRALAAEIQAAGSGGTFAQVRRTPDGERVVSVSVPIRRVQALLGVLTLEAGDFEEVVAAQRRALIPFILVAMSVSLLSSLLLAHFIAQPINRLAQAADRVRLSRARAISLPVLAGRRDEIGDLTRALEAMTDALSERIDAIEAFAADVAHEIRNPLTSIRSAVETLDLVRDEAPRRRLLDILKQDVQRLDRLVTDISNASRLDAELSRDAPRPIQLDRMLSELISLTADVRRPGEAELLYLPPDDPPVFVSGREGPLGQVFRNLIDNAKSFSPPGGRVSVSLSREAADALVSVEDEGPGLPPENLETIFQRFYTSRPKGAAFGGNSGLGLSIARQIVEAHGGRIWAENRVDAEGRVSGARFRVALPAAGQERSR